MEIIIIAVVAYIVSGVITYGILYGVLYEIDLIYIKYSEPSSHKHRLMPTIIALLSPIGLVAAIVVSVVLSISLDHSFRLRYTNKDLRKRWEEMHSKQTIK